MSRIGKLLRLAPVPGIICGGGALRRTMAGSIVAVVLFSAPAAAFATEGLPADQIGATKAEISALESQVAAGAAEVHALTEAYFQASLRSQVLASEVAADERQISELHQRVSGDQEALRQEAILTYTGGAVAGLAGASGRARISGTLLAAVDGSERPFEGPADPAVRAGYLSVAVGDMTDTVDRYKSEQAQLAEAAARLERQQLASEAAADQVANARAAVLAQAVVEQSRLGSLEAQLTQLEAQAADAARAGGTGLPVGNGMVAVVGSLVAPGGDAGGVWLRLRECESGNNYRANTGNGYYGAYQFSQQTWTNLGYPGRPDLEPPAMQDAAAQKLQREAGWGQWPACSAALGLT